MSGIGRHCSALHHSLVVPEPHGDFRFGRFLGSVTMCQMTCKIGANFSSAI